MYIQTTCTCTLYLVSTDCKCHLFQGDLHQSLRDVHVPTRLSGHLETGLKADGVDHCNQHTIRHIHMYTCTRTLYMYFNGSYSYGSVAEKRTQKSASHTCINGSESHFLP